MHLVPSHWNFGPAAADGPTAGRGVRVWVYGAHCARVQLLLNGRALRTEPLAPGLNSTLLFFACAGGRGASDSGLPSPFDSERGVGWVSRDKHTQYGSLCTPIPRKHIYMHTCMLFAVCGLARPF